MEKLGQKHNSVGIVRKKEQVQFSTAESALLPTVGAKVCCNGR